MKKTRPLFVALCFFALVVAGFLSAAPHSASAHEQYVLSKTQFAADYAATGVNVWSALRDPNNLKIGLSVAIGIAILFTIYFFIVSSRLQPWLNRMFGKLDPLGHAFVRIAVGLSLIYSAMTSVYLGPEIPQSSLPFGSIIHYALYVVGILLVLGLFSEFAGAVAALIILAATWAYKDYMLTYFNYFGEFFALAFLGSRSFSLDKLFFGIKKIGEKFKDYEVLLLRVTYGISILYPAITIKFIHPEVIVDIATRYHLNQIHWLFPQDPLLISLGTGLAQVLVGICIIIGFETRLATLVTFTLYILSVLFFKETVWPHYILLALSFYFAINNGGKFTVDTWVENAMAKRRARRAALAA